MQSERYQTLGSGSRILRYHSYVAGSNHFQAKHRAHLRAGHGLCSGGLTGKGPRRVFHCRAIEHREAALRRQSAGG